MDPIACFSCFCVLLGMIRAGPSISKAQASLWNPESLIHVKYKKPVYLTIMDCFPFAHGVAASGSQNCWKVKEHDVHARILEQIELVCSTFCVFLLRVIARGGQAKGAELSKQIQQQWVDQKNHTAKAEEAKLWKKHLTQDLQKTDDERAKENDRDKNDLQMNDIESAVNDEKYRLLEMVCFNHSFVIDCDM